MIIYAKKVYQLLSEFIFPTIAIQFFWYLLCSFLLSGFSFYNSTFIWVSSLIIVLMTQGVIILCFTHTHTLKLRSDELIASHYFKNQTRYKLNEYQFEPVIERDKKDNEIRGKKIVLIHHKTQKRSEINCFPFEDSDFIKLMEQLKKSG